MHAFAHSAHSEAVAMSEAILKPKAMRTSAIKSQIMCSSGGEEPVSVSTATGHVVLREGVPKKQGSAVRSERCRCHLKRKPVRREVA